MQLQLELELDLPEPDKTDKEKDEDEDRGFCIVNDDDLKTATTYEIFSVKK